jgi:PAS domain S-box-containing protein
MTIATRAIELLTKPAVVLDRKGIIYLFNEEMQRLLGRARDEALDRSWLDLCVPKEAQESTRTCFEQVMRGALAECECKAITKSGIRLRLRLDASCVGTGPQAALLAIVRESEREESEADSALDGTHYEISTAPHEWGVLRSIRTSSGAVAGARGQPCFMALEKRQTPCPQCPVQALKDGEIATAVIASNDSDLPLRMVSARSVKGQGAAVIGRTLDDKIIAQIVDAKLLVVSKQRHLSPRERDVLRSLLRGDSSQDIATALGISPRTVKFHQANLLRKLGAESRLELVRWLL